MPEPDESQLKAWRLAAMGTEFGATIVAGVVLGYYLDGWLGTAPLFLLVVSMAAFAGSLYRMVATLRRYQ